MRLRASDLAHKTTDAPCSKRQLVFVLFLKGNALQKQTTNEKGVAHSWAVGLLTNGALPGLHRHTSCSGRSSHPPPSQTSFGVEISVVLLQGAKFWSTLPSPTRLRGRLHTPVFLLVSRSHQPDKGTPSTPGTLLKPGAVSKGFRGTRPKKVRLVSVAPSTRKYSGEAVVASTKRGPRWVSTHRSTARPGGASL